MTILEVFLTLFSQNRLQESDRRRRAQATWRYTHAVGPGVGLQNGGEEAGGEGEAGHPEDGWGV